MSIALRQARGTSKYYHYILSTPREEIPWIEWHYLVSPSSNLDLKFGQVTFVILKCQLLKGVWNRNVKIHIQ